MILNSPLPSDTTNNFSLASMMANANVTASNMFGEISCMPSNLSTSYQAAQQMH